jgi:hypothetical protein
MSKSIEDILDENVGADIEKGATLFRGLQREEFRFWRDVLAAGRFPWQPSPDNWRDEVQPSRLFNLLCFYFHEESGGDYVDDINNGKERGAQVRMGWMLSEFTTPPAELLKDPSPENIKAVAKRLRYRTMKKQDGKVAWVYRFGPVEALRPIFEHKTRSTPFWGPSWTWAILGQMAEDKWARWYKSNPQGFSYYVPLETDEDQAEEA